MSGRSPRWFNGFDRLWEPNFADNSWKQVIWCCQNRFIPHTWAVGDQLIMTIDGDDYPIDIIFHHPEATLNIFHHLCIIPA